MFRHIPAASWAPLSSNTYPSSSQQTTISNDFSSSSFLAPTSSSSTTLPSGSSFLLSPLPPPSPFDSSSSSSSFTSSSNFRSFIVPPIPSSFLLSGDRTTDASASGNRDFHMDGDVHRSLHHSSGNTFLDDGKSNHLDVIHSNKQDGIYGHNSSYGDESPFGFDAEDSQVKKAPAFGYHQNIEVTVSSTSGLEESNSSSLNVQDCPDYFDKYSSFYSSLVNASAILDELKDVFIHVNLPDDQIIDYDFGKSSATIKCQTFVHCAPLQFRVSVFKNTYLPNHPQQAKFIVEFQKREGCCIAFRHVYKLLREKMSLQLRCGDVATPLGNVVPPCFTSQMADLSINEKKSSSAPQTQSSTNSPPSSSPSSYDSFSLTPRPKLDKDSARLLCEMASSDCIQSSREALRALCHASMVDSRAAAEAITSSAEQFINYFQMLSTILTECGNSTYSQDQELVRCCLNFISNLIEPPSSEQKESESSSSFQCVDDIRSALFSSQSQLAGAQLVKLCIEYINAFPHVFEDLLKMREIKRQSARLISALAEVRGEDLKNLLQSDDVNVLEMHANCEDAKLQQYIHTILAKIK